MTEVVIYTIFAIFAVYGVYAAARETVLFISRLASKSEKDAHTLCGGCQGCPMASEDLTDCAEDTDCCEDSFTEEGTDETGEESDAM